MKIAIVDLRTKKVQTTYEADKIGDVLFGGPWGDPLRCEHVKIPTELETEPIQNLEAVDSEEQVDVIHVQDGETLVYDSENKPVKGKFGESIKIPKFVEKPVMKPARLMRRKI